MTDYKKVKHSLHKILWGLQNTTHCLSKNFFRPESLTYGDLFFISRISKKLFIKAKAQSLERALEKIRNKKKIKIGFVVYTGSMWFTDQLYQKLSMNKRFDAEIIVSRFLMDSASSAEDTYRFAKEYFENKKSYKTISPRDPDFDINSYDLLFYMSPYDFDEKQVNIQDVKVSTLTCYLSYSYMLAENINKINLPMYSLVWMFFADSAFYMEMVKKNSRIYTNNAIYLGYPKMDEYYKLTESQKQDERKVIIYAPHQSVHYTGVKSATFEQNYRFMLEIAKEYSQSTYWYMKPHPLLRDNSVKAGIFKTVEEYDLYMDEWQSLSNAEVVLQGDYIHIFKKSDAMITDSISFLAEYQFTSNPLLLLMSGKQIYNAFGQALVDLLYRCDGSDEVYVREFIDNVIQEKDSMYGKRESFFRKNLDYLTAFGKDANTLIYEKIIGEL